MTLQSYRLLLVGFVFGQSLDVLFQNVIGRLRHGAVVVALHLVERHVLVACELQHASEVGLLLIAAIELQFPVTRDDDHRRCIRTNIGEWGILVDGSL